MHPAGYIMLVMTACNALHTHLAGAVCVPPAQDTLFRDWYLSASITTVTDYSACCAWALSQQPQATRFSFWNASLNPSVDNCRSWYDANTSAPGSPVDGAESAQREALTLCFASMLPRRLGHKFSLIKSVRCKLTLQKHNILARAAWSL